MNKNKTFSLITLMLILAGCKPGRTSELDDISGRLSMGPKDAFQCNNFSYSGNEQVNGMWVAGVDGTTFGSKVDGTITGSCGKTFSISNTKTGQSAQFIVVDRIWQNDGPGGQLYNSKSDADAKSGGSGSGYQQVDIAVGAFNSLFGGNNPAPGSYSVNGL